MANGNQGSYPLDKRHLDKLNNVIQGCARTGELIERCKNCGLDVEQAERENNEQRRIAEGIKRNFFPGSV